MATRQLSRIASSVLKVNCYQQGSCVGGPKSFHNLPFWKASTLSLHYQSVKCSFFSGHTVYSLLASYKYYFVKVAKNLSSTFTFRLKVEQFEIEVKKNHFALPPARPFQNVKSYYIDKILLSSFSGSVTDEATMESLYQHVQIFTLVSFSAYNAQSSYLSLNDCKFQKGMFDRIKNLLKRRQEKRFSHRRIKFCAQAWL